MIVCPRDLIHDFVVYKNGFTCTDGFNNCHINMLYQRSCEYLWAMAITWGPCKKEGSINIQSGDCLEPITLTPVLAAFQSHRVDGLRVNFVR